MDELPSAPRLVALGLQHVLVMYANAIAVPLIIGGALHLPKEQLAFLINADLFSCGIATLIQTVGVGPLGIRLPIIMGVTAVAISPMLAIAAMPGVGLNGIYGAVIAGGVFGLFAVPFIGRALPFFPPVVTGSILTMIGITLMRVAVSWAGGGAATPNFGSVGFVLVAGFVVSVILLLIRFGRGFIASIAVLLGIVAGYILSLILGWTSFVGLAAAPWFRLVLPLQFGLPTFHLVPCLIMCLVTMIVFIEATGMFLALGTMVGREVSTEDIKRGLRADAAGTIIGGIFNTFPYLSYSQNIGLVSVTNVKSRWVCAAGGVIMLVFGLIPKLAFIAASVPFYVLGGAAIVMFGMVAAAGIRILAAIDYRQRSHDGLITAVSLGVGLIPILSPQFFHTIPAVLHPIFGDPILLTAIVVLLLNLVFNWSSKQAEKPHRAGESPMPAQD